MPRLPPSLFLQARAENPLLARLLPACRDLPSARNELRWLREHVINRASKAKCKGSGEARGQNAIPLEDYRQQKLRVSASDAEQHSTLKRLCTERGYGRPLQYILGTEYFGSLEIECRPGVLIPRPETAEITTELVRRLTTAPKLPNENRVLPKQLRVLDLCSGTGCMSLLFQHELAKACRNTIAITALGVDISLRAVTLARSNLRRQLSSAEFCRHGESTMDFARADVLSTELSSGVAENRARGLMEMLRQRGEMTWDVLLANPPYISPRQIYSTTARSVRIYEPRLALVPLLLQPSSSSVVSEVTSPRMSTPGRGVSAAIVEHESGDREDAVQADLFYPRLLCLAEKLGVKIILMEVGDTVQALRVARLAAQQSTEHLPHSSTSDDNTTIAQPQEKTWKRVEIWRDGLGAWGADVVSESVDGGRIAIKGPRAETSGRAVVCWRGEGGHWMTD